MPSRQRSRQPDTPLAEAARRLGSTPDALCKRIERGLLPAEKRDGRWFVDLDPDNLSRQADESTGQASRQPDTPVSRHQDIDLMVVITAKDALIEAQAVDLAYLRSELSASLRALASERERSDTLQRIALDRIEALAAGLAPESAEAAPDAHQAAQKGSGTTIPPSPSMN